MVIKIIQGDITEQEVDIIVNAANSHLAPGGGVCGSIFRVGGQSIFDECEEQIGVLSVQTGECVATSAGNLKAKYVIHAVGPIWKGGYLAESYSLEKAYTNALALALTLGAKTIAFPSISTGIFGFPVELAAKIALKQATTFQDMFEEIRFVLFDNLTFNTFDKELSYNIK